MTDERRTEEVMAAARAGDRAAFDRLVAGVYSDLRAFATSRLGPTLRARLEPEDIVQETLLRAFEHVGRFEWRGPESLRRWLFTIAEHVVRNASRKRTLSTGELSVHAPGDGTSPSRALRREERLDRLEASLAGLSPEHRRVIELARIEGLTSTEIAARMGRSPGAIRQLLSRALASLRERFGDTESLGLPDRPLGGRTGDAERGGEDDA